MLFHVFFGEAIVRITEMEDQKVQNSKNCRCPHSQAKILGAAVVAVRSW